MLGGGTFLDILIKDPKGGFSALWGGGFNVEFYDIFKLTKTL